MKKQCRIYYVPGVISLILLPVLCYLYLKPYLGKDERVLEIVFMEKYKFSDNYNQWPHYDTSTLSKAPYRRTYDTFFLNGFRDDVKLESFRVLVRNMVTKKDTIKGVHIEMLDASKYGSFVKAINIFKQETLRSFAAFENQVWGLYIPYDKETLERIKKRKAESDILNNAMMMEKCMKEASFLVRIKGVWKVWPLFIGILIITVFSIFKKRKINKFRIKIHGYGAL
jgi:hypothetical protein